MAMIPMNMILLFRLQRDSETKRASKDADVEPDEDGHFSGKKEHNIHIKCNNENVSPKCTTRSVMRIRSRKYPEPTTDIDSDDSEIDMSHMSKLKGL